MSKAVSAKTFRRLLTSLKGKPCWGVVAGQGNGSMMTLDIGRKIKRSVPLTNRKLSSKLRHYMAEYCVFIQFCAWRLERDNQIVGGWGESEKRIGKVTQQLCGRKITGVKITSPAYDLTISFNGRMRLILFCDQTLPKAYENYSIRSPSGWFTVAGKSILEFEVTHSRQR